MSRVTQAVIGVWTRPGLGSRPAAAAQPPRVHFYPGLRLAAAANLNKLKLAAAEYLNKLPIIPGQARQT